MSVELEDAKLKVAAYQKQCDEFLKTLVQQKREADEAQKAVAQKGERIKEEEVKCQAMADVAQGDLDEALPALEEATKVGIDLSLYFSLISEMFFFFFY